MYIYKNKYLNGYVVRPENVKRTLFKRYTILAHNIRTTNLPSGGEWGVINDERDISFSITRFLFFFFHRPKLSRWIRRNVDATAINFDEISVALVRLVSAEPRKRVPPIEIYAPRTFIVYHLRDYRTRSNRPPDVFLRTIRAFPR